MRIHACSLSSKYGFMHFLIFFTKKDTTLVIRSNKKHRKSLHIYGFMHILFTKLLNRWHPKTTFCNRRFENNNTTSFFYSNRNITILLQTWTNNNVTWKFCLKCAWNLVINQKIKKISLFLSMSNLSYYKYKTLSSSRFTHFVSIDCLLFWSIVLYWKVSMSSKGYYARAKLHHDILRMLDPPMLSLLSSRNS